MCTFSRSHYMAAVQHQRIVLARLLFLWIPFSISGQKLVLDSLVLDIRLQSDTVFQSLSIDTVMDWRGINSRIAAFDEVTQYGFIPVDQVILLPRPLPELIMEMFPDDSSNAGSGTGLAVEHLDLSCSKPFPFFRRYNLRASVLILLRSSGDSLLPKGSLVFDSAITGRKKPGTAPRYRFLIEEWLSKLPREVNSTVQALKNGPDMPYHFRMVGSKSVWTRLNAETELITTFDSWMIDGMMFFSYPESHRSFIENRALIRFRSQKKMDSIEWGVFNFSRYHRLKPSWTTVVRTNALFGINRWKDMETAHHQVYDAMIADLSVIESMRYHPRDARTLILGLGIIQDLYYVYSKGLKFQVGVTVQIGVQI
jgi:hypothetical protein